MPYTKGDVGPVRKGDKDVVLSDAERQKIADEWNAAEAAANTITVEQVKAEAHRRILLIADKDKQNNMLAYAIETMRVHGTDPTNWPADRQAINASFSAKWDAIKAIRARSDQIKAMDAIPADFCEDKYWL